MKTAAKNYAKALIAGLDSGQPLSVMAKNFWYLLQKNNQYKSLNEVLALIDQEYAQKHDLILAQVISESKLSDNQKQMIRKKLKDRFGKDALIRNTIKPGLSAGIIAKVNGYEIDSSLDGKVKKLKTILVK